MIRRTRFFAVLALLALITPLTATPAAAQDSGYTGIITDARVEVRSGAGRAYYVVGELESGQRVHVVDVLFEDTWFKVTVPTGIHSYVSKAFVDAQGDGSSGVINADRTEFKAASLRGPGESYRVQGTFSEGDRVEIVGQEGNFYKIIAPTDAFVFIPAGSLRRATADDMQPAEPEETDTPEVTPEPEEIPEVIPQPEETPEIPEVPEVIETPDTPEAIDENTGDTAEPVAGSEEVMPEAGTEGTPDETTQVAEGETVETPEAGTDAAQTQADATTDATTDPESTEPQLTEGGLPALPDVEVTSPARADALKQREMELLPYFHTPIEVRPLDHMESGYREILVSADLSEVDQRIVAVRLRTIARQREILAAMERVAAARAIREPRTEVPDLATLPRTPVEYEAIGTLHVSSVYDGRSLPRMYRLVDPSGRTVAYVAPTPLIDESDLVQALVGVVGSSSYDPALKLQIITPTRLDALAAQGE